jgi:ABC-type transport system involved in Fe-S cluster assembly fused permease/ATPase subunit
MKQALDSRTERAIQESQTKLFRGRTTVVIAHRLSTIKNADEIIVLSPCSDSAKSSVVERGTHDELLKQRGLYFDMWAAQTSSHVTGE